MSRLLIGVSAVLCVFIASSASADFLETWGTGSDPHGWFFGSDNSVPTSGGNPDSYLRRDRTDGFFPWMAAPTYGDATYTQLYGDIWNKHGNDLLFTMDVRVFSSHQLDDIYARFYRNGDAAGTNFSYSGNLATPITSADGWVTITAPLNFAWSDVDAVANGWTESGVTTFNLIFGDLAGRWDTAGSVSGGGVDEPISIGIDNVGFVLIPEPASVGLILLGLGALAFRRGR